MTLYTSNLYGQTDKRWAASKINNTSYSIGGYGCAITAIANLHNLIFDTRITPQMAHDALKKAGVFTGALVNWDRVPKAFPLLKFVFRDWNYNNARVWSWINIFPRLPVIVAVHPQFVPQHFVVFIGGGKLVDSLDGKVKPTSTYKTLIGSVRYTR